MTGSKKLIRVGTRGSSLALRQTEWVVQRLRERVPEYCFEIIKIKTKGDMIQNLSLNEIGGKGLFVKEIEKALLEERIDLAVHSMKDLPSELPAGLTIGAVTERADFRDVLISRAGVRFMDLPVGARIGTSSLRRSAQLRYRRPDLEIRPIRGNVGTRLKKMAAEDLDGVILAAAGLERMGWSDRITERLSPDLCLPAVGQGALGLEVRTGDEKVGQMVQLLNHEETELAVAAERAFLRRLEGGCQVPIAALARFRAGRLYLTGMVASIDGTRLIREEMSVLRAHVEELGRTLAEKILQQGGEEILAEIERKADLG